MPKLVKTLCVSAVTIALQTQIAMAGDQNGVLIKTESNTCSLSGKNTSCSNTTQIADFPGGLFLIALRS